MFCKQDESDLSINPAASHGNFVRSAYVDKHFALVLISGLDNKAASHTAIQGCIDRRKFSSACAHDVPRLRGHFLSSFGNCSAVATARLLLNLFQQLLQLLPARQLLHHCLQQETLEPACAQDACCKVSSAFN